MKTQSIVAGIVCAVLAGCASTPDVQLHYFAAQATTSVLVTQTIECRVSKTEEKGKPATTTKTLSVEHVPTVTTAYSSNRDGSHTHTLPTAAVTSTFADTNVKFDWFDDGRLKSVNVGSTGQGESIVKAVLSLVPAVFGSGPALTADDCDKVTTFGGGKPVTILYEGTVTYDKQGGGEIERLAPTPSSTDTYSAITRLLPQLLPKLDFEVKKWETLATVVGPDPNSKPATDVFPLVLHKTARAPVELLLVRETPGAVTVKTPSWRGSVVVPTDETYELPIPKAKLFGAQTFNLTLNEAGGVTSLGYTSNSGTAAGFNTLTAIAGATAAPSDADKAAALKAQADLIAQTTRLAACQAKPAECK